MIAGRTHSHYSVKDLDGCVSSKCKDASLYKLRYMQTIGKLRGNDGDNTKRIEKYDLHIRKRPERRIKGQIIIRLEGRNKTKEEQFFELAQNWKIETSIYSIAAKKISNSNYMGIIGLGVTYGEPIIKLILEDLKKGVEYWHYALKKITNQNPVPTGSVNNLQTVRNEWLKWGIENEIIS
ncbi:MAG: hypothetical protein QM737_10985 [Ferruginibacter sp.]